MKALACLALAVACGVQQVPAVPHVVTVIQPYVAVVPLAASGGITIGQVQCDRGAGYPYIQIDTTLTPEETAAVLIHENIHVAQVRAYGSCRAFAARYEADTTFRLQVEADAYCGTLNAQRAAKRPADPVFDDIVAMLMQNYRARYTRDAVLKALPCG